MSYKESEYADLIAKLKEPGYLDKFLPHFQKTKRYRTIPEMIQKRHGLLDGRKWTYIEISKSYKRTIKKPDHVEEKDSISSERVRQCLQFGYELILEIERVGYASRKTRQSYR